VLVIARFFSIFPESLLQIPTQSTDYPKYNCQDLQLAASSNAFPFFGSQPGLPDGILSSKKSQIGVNFGGPWNGKVWNMYLEYITSIWYIVWPFGN
jgi:hypothetical protein